MALGAQLASIGNDFIKPELANNWMNTSPLLKWMKGKNKVLQSGINLKFPITYTSVANVTWYTGAQQLPATEADEITNVYYGWKQLGGQLVYTGTELLQNDGPEGKVNLVKAKKQNLVETVQDTIATALYNVGTTATQLDGARLMCDSTGTYPATTGGISATDFTGWAGNEDSSTNTLTRKIMSSFILSQSGSGDDRPDLIITNASCYGKIKDLVASQERWTSAEAVKIGWVTFTFDGIPVQYDTHSPGSGGGSTDNWIFFFNSKHLFFYINSHENFKFDPVLKPIEQNAYCQKMLFAGSFGTTQRRRQGAMQTINPNA